MSVAFDFQQQASNPNSSVWVQASAGTGKTKILTDRVLRLLLETGAKPEQILCLTFTRAAAAEMSERILKTLEAWAHLDQEELQTTLNNMGIKNLSPKLYTRAQSLFYEVLETPVTIQTIHGFCQTLLTRFPLEAGVPPHFKLMDTFSCFDLLQESCSAVLHQIENDDRLQKVFEDLSPFLSENAFQELMEKLILERGKFKTLPNQNQLLEFLDLEPDDTLKNLLENIFADTPKHVLRDFIPIFETGKASDHKIAEIFKSFLNASQNFETIKDYASAYLTKDFEERARFATKDLSTKHPELDVFFRAECLRLKKFFEKYQRSVVATCSHSLLILGEHLLDHYTKTKEKRGLLDFEDLIEKTSSLLSSSDIAPWILYKTDTKIKHLLVDEAQDTSPAQWSVIQNISQDFFSGEGAHAEERTLFVVGDKKQSIYSFQGADPYSFQEMNAFFARATTLAQKQWTDIPLSLSFRSAPAILKVVDALFVPLEHHLLEKDLEHNSFLAEHFGKVCLWPLIEAQKQEVPAWCPPISRPQVMDKETLLAARVAETIHELISHKKYLPNKGRTIQPKDIMVLVRRRTQFVPTLIGFLKKYNLPVTGLDRLILNDHLAIKDLLSFAKFLVLPEDDLNLAILLKSPLIGISEEKLFELAHEREKSLWAEVLKDPDLKDVVSYLQEFLGRHHTPFSLFSTLLHQKQKDLLAHIGREALDPLEEFLEVCLLYEKQNTPSLQHFLHWFEKNPVEIKRDFESKDSNEIRIMTVHGSKGLQAPVVILPDTTTPPTESSKLLWSDDFLAFIPAREFLPPSLEELYERRKQKTLDEYYRLLYVAMTRAEDELHIFGTKPERSLPPTSWYALLQETLENIGDTQGECLVYEEGNPDKKTEEETLFEETKASPFPAWVLEKVPQEKPLTTLRPSEAEGDIKSPAGPAHFDPRRKGTLVHTLLEYLPTLPISAQKDLARSFLLNQTPTLPEDVLDEILNLSLNTLQHKDLKKFFGDNSYAELSFTAQTQEGIVKGQIDRLVIENETVYILDYKTGKLPSPSTPDAYKKQLDCYKQAVAQIHPNKNIKTYLFWCESGTLVSV